jgi:hypothetical protein
MVVFEAESLGIFVIHFPAGRQYLSFFKEKKERIQPPSGLAGNHFCFSKLP